MCLNCLQKFLVGLSWLPTAASCLISSLILPFLTCSISCTSPLNHLAWLRVFFGSDTVLVFNKKTGAGSGVLLQLNVTGSLPIQLSSSEIRKMAIRGLAGHSVLQLACVKAVITSDCGGTDHGPFSSLWSKNCQTQVTLLT